MTDHATRLREAAAHWKGKTRPEGDKDRGEVAVHAEHGGVWWISVSCLDGAKMLDQLADRWADKIIAVDHDPSFATRVRVASEAFSLHSGVRQRREYTDEQRAAMAERMRNARSQS